MAKAMSVHDLINVVNQVLPFPLILGLGLTSHQENHVVLSRERKKKLC